MKWLLVFKAMVECECFCVLALDAYSFHSFTCSERNRC